jgi:hypothetical protein
MEIKHSVKFDDAQFRTYAESAGDMTRFNLTFNKADAAELNAMARALDIDPKRLVRDTLHMIAAMFKEDPQPFIDESKRCHNKRAEALMFAVKDMERAAAKGETHGYKKHCEI